MHAFFYAAYDAFLLMALFEKSVTNHQLKPEKLLKQTSW